MGLLAFSAAAAPVDVDRLWLPQSYAKHWSALRSVAEAAAESENCVQLVRAELAAAKSTPDHPVFGVTCRDINHRTFVSFYDGLSLAELDNRAETPGDPAVLEAPMYEFCLQRWLAALEHMNNVSWLDSIENTRANKVERFERDGRKGAHFYFSRNFDATDLKGAKLEYTALCDGESIASAQARIAPRAQD